MDAPELPAEPDGIDDEGMLGAEAPADPDDREVDDDGMEDEGDDDGIDDEDDEGEGGDDDGIDEEDDGIWGICGIDWLDCCVVVHAFSIRADMPRQSTTFCFNLSILLTSGIAIGPL